MRLDVALDVHAHERRELHEARIDLRGTRRRWRNGTRAIRFCSNQSIDLELASSFTLVGLTRVSIGPAIKVMLRGCAGFSLCAITRDGLQHRDAGLADREHMGALADRLDELDQVVDIFVEAEPAGGARDVAHVVPVGDVDVVLGQHGAHGAAQQRGEMARQRRHQQNARLLGLDVLLEMQQRAEWRDMRGLLAHLHLAVADDDLVDAEGRPRSG